MHIHEDLEAVTYVVEGALRHSDSLGNRGVLTAGGVIVVTRPQRAHRSTAPSSDASGGVNQ